MACLANFAYPKAIEESSLRRVLSVLPQSLVQRIVELPEVFLSNLEELRLRVDRPVELCTNVNSVFLSDQHGTTKQAAEAFQLSVTDVSYVIQNVTQYSLYAVEEELRRGFITIQGGHRVGVAGRVVLNSDGSVKSIRSVSSLNIRVARSFPGVADQLRPVLVSRRTGEAFNTLIVSPPKCGKTTLLRDLARQWSDHVFSQTTPSTRVTIVDERSEIGGCIEGVPQFWVGARTDVLDACPKAEGMMMAIRSLSPDILVTDEIGRREDVQAVLEATHAGVRVFTSAHANDLDDWRRRPYMQELYDSRAFSRYVLLSRRRGPGTIEAILDEQGRALP